MLSKLCMVIPSYWARKGDTIWLPGDAVYDHPTPLDMEGTLLRLLKSLKIIESENLTVIVVAIPTCVEIADDVESKVTAIIKETKKEVDHSIHVFGPSHLKKVHESLESKGRAEFNKLLELKGYSNVRNICLFVAHLQGAKTVILIDDDEVFDDPHFVDKAMEFIGKSYNGYPVYAIAGYYLQEDGDYHVKKAYEPWMEYWDQVDRMNEGFDRFISQPPRLKETPFVFGGNMIIHRNLFMKVPFDPLVPRGEDIDYLINSRMFGYHFFIDNTLAIRHLPPPKSHPAWRRLREDVFRFLFEREKIRGQREMRGMVRVEPEDFDPYPGAFLKGDLEQKVEKASHILAEMYERSGDLDSARETLETVTLMQKILGEEKDPFGDMIRLQERWENLMEFTDRLLFREEMKGILQ